MPDAEVHPASPDRWADVETVMGISGDPAWCWCQYFRTATPRDRLAIRERNRAALRTQVCDDSLPPGVLSYLDGEPVGWCAAAPFSSYARMPRTRVAQAARRDGEDLARLWLVSCFVVRVGSRGQGLSAGLLDGAVELARQHGATALEAHPVDPGAKSSVSAAEIYHGPLSVFVAAGFTEVARPTPARVVVRRGL